MVSDYSHLWQTTLAKCKENIATSRIEKKTHTQRTNTKADHLKMWCMLQCCNTLWFTHFIYIVARVMPNAGSKLWQKSHARLGVWDRTKAHWGSAWRLAKCTHEEKIDEQRHSAIHLVWMRVSKALACAVAVVVVVCSNVLFFRPELQIKLHESQQFIDAYTLSSVHLPSYFVVHARLK